MKYAPEPTPEQLAALTGELAPRGEVRFDHRIEGGLGCTMDVVRVRERSGSETRAILRRRGMWSEHDDINAARTELDVLRLLRSHDVPAPEPLWLDETGIFAEPATLISFIDGEPLMAPDDPVDWATQFARMLARVHDVSPDAEIRSRLTDYNSQESASLAGSEPPKRVAEHHLGPRLWSAQKAELQKTTLEQGIFLHGDYWPGNTLWQGQRLIAVVDFELIGIGDPALDVGTAVVNIWFEPWRAVSDDFVAVYRAETGRSLDSLRFWCLKELKRPMPDISLWLPSFQDMRSMPDFTADELRALHDGLVLEELDRT